MHKGVNKKQKNYLKEKNTKNYAAYMQTNRIHKYAIQYSKFMQSNNSDH